MTQNQDAEHLRLLAIFHYVYAGIVAFYSLFALIYVIMGVVFIAIPFATEGKLEEPKKTVATVPPEVASEDGKTTKPAVAQEPVAENAEADSAESRTEEHYSRDHYRHSDGKKESAIVGAVFAGVGLVILGFGLIYALASLVAGRGIANRKWRGFSMFMAIMNCLHMPMGTVLGVFTLVVLVRPSVKLLYEAGEPQSEPEGKPAPE